jgi:L-iditol 2-dehydrogenase
MAFRRSLLVVGLFDWKLKLASELGATHTINSQEIKDVKKEIKSLYQEGVDACALTVVTKDTIVQSLGSTIKGGYVSIFAGVPKDSVYTTLDPNIIHYNEISLIGSSGYTYEDFRIAFKIAINNESKLSRLVPHRFRLDDIHDAITAWEDKERSLKILLKR